MTKTTLRSQIIRLAHENPELRAELLPLLKEAEFVDGKPRCDMVEGCTKPVTHIDKDGYIYCEKHAAQRKSGGVPVRKLKPAEIKKLEQGQTVSKYAGCEKLPEGGMRDNCEKKKEEGKKSDKTAATAAVRKTVTLIVRVLRTEELDPGLYEVESGYTDINIWGQISIDFGGSISPDAVRFKARVTQDPSGKFTVYDFEPMKTVSGGGAELLIGVLMSALQEALDLRGESLIRI